jgi:hypothetical protein
MAEVIQRAIAAGYTAAPAVRKLNSLYDRLEYCTLERIYEI